MARSLAQERWVLHIDMDAFFASVEQLTRPTLRGRPVLVGGLSGRGVVSGASYEARERGAHSAMPMFQAQPLIGYRGIVVAPRISVYSAASRRVFHVLAQHVDVVEKISIDEGFLEPSELSGATPEEVERWAQRVRSDIFRVTGLPSSIGAASGRQTAKIASGLAKPDGVCIIADSVREDILYGLSVGKLWGIGPVTRRKLQAMGITTIGQFAQMDAADVAGSLGHTVGLGLWNLARGIDDVPVTPRAIAKQISQEHTYPLDLVTRESAHAAVERTFAGAYRRLRADGRAARTVSVKIKMANFRTETRSRTLAYATDDATILRAIAYKLMRYPAEIGPIRLVGVSFSGLENTPQSLLFPELDVCETEETTRISSAEALSESVEKQDTSLWVPTQDIAHEYLGHGWVQGTGHGIVSIRFETRTTGPGHAQTFDDDDPLLHAADPLASLDWEEDTASD